MIPTGIACQHLSGRLDSGLPQSCRHLREADSFRGFHCNRKIASLCVQCRLNDLLCAGWVVASIQCRRSLTKTKWNEDHNGSPHAKKTSQKVWIIASAIPAALSDVPVSRVSTIFKLPVLIFSMYSFFRGDNIPVVHIMVQWSLERYCVQHSTFIGGEHWYSCSK